MYILYVLSLSLYWISAYALPFAIGLGCFIYTKTSKKTLKNLVVILFSAWPFYMLFFLSLGGLTSLFIEDRNTLGALKAVETVVYLRRAVFFATFLIVAILPFLYFHHKDKIKVLLLSALWWWTLYIPSYFISSHVIDKINIEIQAKNNSK